MEKGRKGQEKKLQRERQSLCGVGTETDIAEAVDGALDDERGGDEEREHGGDGPGGRQRQRPHLPPPARRAGALAAGHLPPTLFRPALAKREQQQHSRETGRRAHCSGRSSSSS